MKYILTACTAALLLFVTLSCNRPKADSDLAIASDINRKILSSDSTADNAASEFQLPERRFVRTASLKCKVPSVSEAVTVIENRTRALGGYVGLSHFVNNILDSTGIFISRDSSMQVIHYSTSGFLTLRVPDYMLDSLLADLRPMSSVILDREIRANDVSLQMLAQQLTRQRAVKTEGRLETDIRQRGKKLSDIEQAEKTLEERQAMADEAKIAGLHLEDAVRFSTVSLEIYQNAGIRYQEIAREKYIAEYQVPFLDQVGDSLSYGWQGFQDFLIFLCRFWVILILALLGYIIFNRQFHPVKKIKTV